MTSSAAGIYGNFGQANYSAAKLGILGLSNTLALEGKKYNISCNTLAPTAGSRLTQTVMPQNLVDQLKPEYVAPLVLYLCHDSCQETGGLFECGGGWMAKLQWQRADGATIRQKNVEMTPEAVRDNWEKVTDFSVSSNPKTVGEANIKVYEVLGKLEADDDEDVPQVSAKPGIDPDVAIGQKLPAFDMKYTDTEVILYALGVGVSTKQEDHLKFLYEHHEDFSVLPTYSVILASMASRGMFTGQIPGLGIDITKILHGEQYTEVFKPLPSKGTVTSEATIVDVLDKGSGAIIIINIDSFDESGDKIAFNQFTTFVQKAGGFGGKRTSDKAINPVNPPKRAPDAVVTEKTGIDQVGSNLCNHKIFVYCAMEPSAVC